MDPTDHTLDAAQAVVTALKGWAPLSSIVGDKVYHFDRPNSPEEPWISVGTFIAGPYEATCLGGTEATFAVSSFAIGGTFTAGMSKEVVECLDGNTLAIGLNAHTVALDWVSTEMVQDSADRRLMQGIVQFDIRTADDY